MIKSLRVQLSLLLITAASMTLAGLGYYGHSQLVDELNGSFRAMQAGTMNRIAESVTTPLWEVNADALANILHAQLESPDIAALAVLDKDGTTIAAFEHDAHANIVAAKEIGPNNELTIERDIASPDQSNEPIGRLVIRFTRDKLDATIQRDIYQLVLQVVAVNIALILLLLASLRVVFRPLSELREALMHLASQDEGAKTAITELPEGRYREIAGVIRGFNFVLRKTHQAQQAMLTEAEGRSTMSQVALELRQAESFPGLVQTFMRNASRLLDVRYGLLFVADPERQVLKLIGGYGLPVEEIGREVAFGGGLAGQCAIEKKPLLLDKPPKGYIRITSGTGSTPPACILIRPLILKGRLVGVLELATLRLLTEKDAVMLAELEHIVAAQVELMRHREAMEIEFARQKASEERIQAIINSVSDGIYGLDMDGNTIFINPAAAHMLGYAPEELIGTSMHAAVHHTHADGTPFPREACPMYLTSQDGQPRFVSDDVMWSKDGSSVQVEYNTVPLTDKDGRQVGSVVAIRNIGERKLAESRLREQFAFQQALIDTIPYPLFYKGADTRFLGFNRAYEEAFNVRRADLIGKRVLDLQYLPEADRIAYQTEDERVIAEADAVQREMAIPFADGKLHDTIYFVSGFRHEDGSPGGLVGTFIDVSDRKKIEDLERFQRLALGREERIMELKQEVNALAVEAHKEKPYSVENIFLESGVAPIAEGMLDSPESQVEDIRRDFADLFQREHLRELLDNFCEAVGITVAIIDLEDKILASSRWQPLSNDFEPANAQSYKNCIDKETKLDSQLVGEVEFTIYRCQNGMTKCTAPIIINGHHIANVFIGQFHLKKPDLAFFRRQAAKLGFNAETYLAVVKKVPVLDEVKLPQVLSFLSQLVHLVGTFAVKQLEARTHAYALQRERIAAISLAEDAEMARAKLASSQA